MQLCTKGNREVVISVTLVEILYISKDSGEHTRDVSGSGLPRGPPQSIEPIQFRTVSAGSRGHGAMETESSAADGVIASRVLDLFNVYLPDMIPITDLFSGAV